MKSCVSLENESNVLKRFNESNDKIAIVHLLTQVENVFGLKQEKSWNNEKKKELLGLSFYKKLLSWKLLLCCSFFLFFPIFLVIFNLFVDSNFNNNYVSIVWMFFFVALFISLTWCKELSIGVKKLFIPVSNRFIDIVRNEFFTDKCPLQVKFFLKNMGIRDDLSAFEQKEAIENFMSWALSLFKVTNNMSRVDFVEDFLSNFEKNKVTEPWVWSKVLLVVESISLSGCYFKDDDLKEMGIDFEPYDLSLDLDQEAIKLHAINVFCNMEKK